MTGQIDGSIVVWDDGNAGNSAQPRVGLPGNPAVRYSCGECRLRIGTAQAIYGGDQSRAELHDVISDKGSAHSVPDTRCLACRSDSWLLVNSN